MRINRNNKNNNLYYVRVTVPAKKQFDVYFQSKHAVS